MAFDYKKEYKDLYLPKEKPMLIMVPKMKFIMVDGTGDPNTAKSYSEAIEILYGLSFTIKMSKMGNEKIKDYFEYVVPPLEGLWNSPGEFKKEEKDKLIWTSMIRQPEFVTQEVFEWAKEKLKIKKPELDLSKAYFKEFEEGKCVQIMHIGPYDDEPRSFELINNFIKENNLERKDFKEYHHHEIYLSDVRKVSADKLKTVLRAPIK